MLHAQEMLFGMAIGDALGASVEFRSPERIEQEGVITDIIGGGWLSLQPGQTTDDTQMAICLGTSIVDANGYTTKHAMRRYLQWLHSHPPDVGMTISAVLHAVDHGDTPAGATLQQHQSSGGMSAGNGSLMRCWPLIAAYTGSNMEQALRYDSTSTHYDPLAADACVFAGRLAHWMDAYTSDWNEYVEAGITQAAQGLDERIYEAAIVEAQQAKDESMQAMGFVLTAVSIACAGLRMGQEGLLWAVNCGGDADTNAAITGALIGASGVEWSKQWIEMIDVHDELVQLATVLPQTEWNVPLDERNVQVDS